MEPLKVLALIFGVLLLAKLIMAIANPKPSMKLAKKLLKHQTFTTIVYLVLIAVVGIYVFRSLNILQVSAAILLGVLLIGLCLVPYSDVMLKVANVIMGHNMIKKDWLGLALWAGLAMWAIIAAFV